MYVSFTDGALETFTAVRLAVSFDVSVLNVLFGAVVSEVASALALIPPAELMVKMTPRVFQLSVSDPPAAMSANVSVWVAPSLARVIVTWPGVELVSV